MKKIIKRIFWAVVICFCIFFIWQRFFNRDKGDQYESYRVSYGDVVETVSDSGELQPVTYANLSFEIPTTLEWVGAAVGDTVRAGQVLMRIDRKQLSAQIRAAQIDVEKAIATEELARRKWDEYKPEERYRIKKDVEQARAQLAATQAQWSKTELTSPIDGIVTVQNVRVGEVVTGVAMRVIDPKNMHIESYMSESDITEMYIDQMAQITFDAFDDEIYAAHITQIDPEAVVIQDVTYYKTILVLDQIDDRMRAGMSVDVDIIASERKDVLVIPLRFVRGDDMGNFVFIKNGEEYEKLYVTLGVEGDSGDVEVISGLSDGQEIYAIYDENDDDK